MNAHVVNEIKLAEMVVYELHSRCAVAAWPRVTSGPGASIQLVVLFS